MSPSKLKNFRFDEHYAGLLAFFAERFETTESDIVRRLLDHVNMEYGMELRFAERFIEQLKERHGAEARLEFRLIAGTETVSAPRHYAPRYLPEDVVVFVDGESDDGLIAQFLLGSTEERMAGVERCRIALLPRAGDDAPYFGGVGGRYVTLYIGELDPASPASLSIRVGDLRKEMQMFHWMHDWTAREREDGVTEGEPAFVLDSTDDQV